MSASWELTPEIWTAIATSCVHLHELRSVCNVARDLSSLQSVCKSSQSCAADVWPDVAALCSYVESEVAVAGCTIEQLKKRLPNSDQCLQETLDKALQLAPAKLAIFIQRQCERELVLHGTQAVGQYGLSFEDLESVKHQLICLPQRNSVFDRRYSRQDLIDAANKKWHSVEAFREYNEILASSNTQEVG